MPIPPHIAHALWIVRTLLAYGRHIVATLESRAAARTFAVIAYCFGTSRVPAILARLQRGILRAMALERLLLARAARGRDLTMLKQQEYSSRKPGPAAQPGADAPPARAPRQPPQRSSANHPADLEDLPTLEELEADVRGRTVGRAVADICLDLGVRPALCSVTFWNEIFDVLHWYRGNLPKLMTDMHRREIAYDKETRRFPALSLPPRTREGTKRALGFFVGEAPVNPYAEVVAAVARAATAAFMPTAAAPARPP